MSTTKLSVTLDTQVAKSLKKYVSRQNVSRFVSEAIKHELERQQMRELIASMEREIGPPDPAVVEEARAAFAAIRRPSASKRRTRKPAAR